MSLIKDKFNLIKSILIAKFSFMKKCIKVDKYYRMKIIFQKIK